MRRADKDTSPRPYPGVTFSRGRWTINKYIRKRSRDRCRGMEFGRTEGARVGVDENR